MRTLLQRGVGNLYHPHLPSVAAGAHGEVQPVAASLVALQQQLVEVLFRLVADVEQDGGIADELFQPCHTDVRRTARSHAVVVVYQSPVLLVRAPDC